MRDPYSYPDSSVLINLFDIRDADELERIERELTYTKLGLLSQQIIGSFDLAHFKRIHFELFGELYSWAGQFRTVDIAKEQTLFCRMNFLEGEAERLFQRLRLWVFQPIAHAESLAQLAGGLLTDLNMLHPFREGNGRTQREFVRQLARYHGFYLDYDRMDAEAYMAASVSDRAEEMAHVLRRAIPQVVPDRMLRDQYQAASSNEYER